MIKIVSSKKYRKMKTELNTYRVEAGAFAPGNFYSPIPSEKDIEERYRTLKPSLDLFKGIDLNIEGQLANLQEFKTLASEVFFEHEKKEGVRYYSNNPSFASFDGIILYSMIRKLSPKNIIEVGSGYTSGLMMDVNDRFFDGKINISFIEPYSRLLKNNLSKEDIKRTTLYETRLQDVDLSIFEKLKENDILFIDSTHVCKVNSDVQKIFSDILPVLNKGVYIHFHDIFGMFEYPKRWLDAGWFWNEDYVLRAFLQYNNSFKIEFFNDFLKTFYEKEISELDFFPTQPSYGSLWLKKIK